MICKHCGKENEEGSKFCMWCGQIFEEQYNREMQQQTPYEQQTGAVGNQQQYQQNPYRQQPGGAGYQQQYQQNPYRQQPGMNGYQSGMMGPLPMNWYNFVAKVQYILILIANAYVLVWLLFMGGIYGSKEGQEFMHEVSGAFIVVDVLYIILIVIASVLCVLVRQKLVKFQKDAWKWYIGYLIFNLGASVIYYIGLAIVYGAVGFSASVFATRIITSLFASGIDITLNYIYFNKRKHLFVN